MPAPSSSDLEQLDLDLVLDRQAEVPIGVQLAWALRARLRDGTLTPGQRLPGLRDLATALHINANTVRAVYQRLEHEGILVSRQGSGTFVADTPSQAPSAAGAIAAQAAQAALDTGVDPRDVAAALYVAPPAGAPGAKSSSRSAAAGALAARRRRLRAQIAALQRTLGEFEARHPALVPMPAEPIGRAGPRLLDVEELEQVQAQLISRLAALHAAIDKLAARTSDPASASTSARQRKAAKTQEGGAGKAPRRATARARSASASASAATPTPTRARPAPAGA